MVVPPSASRSRGYSLAGGRPLLLPGVDQQGSPAVQVAPGALLPAVGIEPPGGRDSGARGGFACSAGALPGLPTESRCDPTGITPPALGNRTPTTPTHWRWSMICSTGLPTVWLTASSPASVPSVSRTLGLTSPLRPSALAFTPTRCASERRRALSPSSRTGRDAACTSAPRTSTHGGTRAGLLRAVESGRPSLRACGKGRIVASRGFHPHRNRRLCGDFASIPLL